MGVLGGGYVIVCVEVVQFSSEGGLPLCMEKGLREVYVWVSSWDGFNWL